MRNVSFLLLVFPISGLLVTSGSPTETASSTGPSATTPSNPTTTTTTTTIMATHLTPETWNMGLVWPLDKPCKPSEKEDYVFKQTPLRRTLFPTERYIFRNGPPEDTSLLVWNPMELGVKAPDEGPVKLSDGERVMLIPDSTGRYWLYGAVLAEERS